MLVMIRTAGEKGGNYQGLWMGCLAQTGDNCTGEMRTPCPRQGWGLQPRCRRGHCLGQGEDGTGHPPSSRSSSKGCDEGGGDSRSGGRGVWNRGGLSCGLRRGQEDWCHLTLLPGGEVWLPRGPREMALVPSHLGPQTPPPRDDMYLCLFRQ